jgi:hypothetical protein
MTEQGRTLTQRTYPWPVLGLLLVALFVGHDLLMASGVAAAPRHATPVAHHDSRGHDPITTTSLSQSSDPEPRHPAQCRIGLIAISPNADGDDAGSAGLGHATIASALPSAFSSDRYERFVWEEPHWPPGTLRALVQVYRI